MTFWNITTFRTLFPHAPGSSFYENRLQKLDTHAAVPSKATRRTTKRSDVARRRLLWIKRHRFVPAKQTASKDPDGFHELTTKKFPKRSSQHHMPGIPLASEEVYRRILNDPRLLSQRIQDMRFVLGDVTRTSFRSIYDRYTSILNTTIEVMREHVVRANLTKSDAKIVQDLVMASTDF